MSSVCGHVTYEQCHVTSLDHVIFGVSRMVSIRLVTDPQQDQQPARPVYCPLVVLFILLTRYSHVYCQAAQEKVREQDGGIVMVWRQTCLCSRVQQLRDSPAPRRSPRLSQKYYPQGASTGHPLYSRASMRTYTSASSTSVLNESGQSVPSSFDDDDTSSITTASTLDEDSSHYSPSRHGK